MFAVLVAAHNEWAAWAVVGAVLSSFLCKVLKHVINEQRPASARKKDPGMPSSHSNSECAGAGRCRALCACSHCQSQQRALAAGG